MIILGIAVSVLAVIGIGLLVSRKVDGDSVNFLVAGRSLGLPLVAAGLMGQAVDSNATLGNTDLAGSVGFWAGATLPLGLGLCLLLTGLFFAKPMNRMGLLTLPDFYRIKYGRGVEFTASILMIFSFCILLAGNLVAGGFLFERFLGIPYSAGVVLIVVIVLTYTVTGGMFSDAYTALAQMVITVIGSLALLIWVGSTYGIHIPEGMGPFDLGQLTSSSDGAMVNWATLIALGIGDIVAIDFMQRIFSARSPKPPAAPASWAPPERPSSGSRTPWSHWPPPMSSAATTARDCWRCWTNTPRPAWRSWCCPRSSRPRAPPPTALSSAPRRWRPAISPDAPTGPTRPDATPCCGMCGSP